MVGVGALLGDVGAHMGLVMHGGGSFQLLGCPIVLVFGSEVVGHNLAALASFHWQMGLQCVWAGLGQVWAWWGHSRVAGNLWWVRTSIEACLHVGSWWLLWALRPVRQL